MHGCVYVVGDGAPRRDGAQDETNRFSRRGTAFYLLMIIASIDNLLFSVFTRSGFVFVVMGTYR